MSQSTFRMKSWAKTASHSRWKNCLNFHAGPCKWWNSAISSRRNYSVASSSERPLLSTSEAKKNILITAALPYVNNVPHLGNLIGAILSADIYARYQKLYPSHIRNVRFICGTDEYGTATETRARKENIAPDALCEKYFWKHKELYEWFEIQFDAFGRTSQGNSHKEIVASIYRDLEDQNFFLEQEIQQWYCENDQMYLADRFVRGECPTCGEESNGDQCDHCGTVLESALNLKHAKCAMCSTSPVVRHTNHLFLDIKKGKEPLKQWYDSIIAKEHDLQSMTHNEEDNRHIAWSSVAKGLTQGLLQHDDFPARCITRDLKWGVPVPHHEKRADRFADKVFYVWFDAPIGYISIMAEKFADWKDWWFTASENNTPNPSVQYVQFMGKDNVPFHSIYFPLMLLGTKKPWKLVDALQSTHYLNYEDGKFSKSQGTGVFCDSAKESGIPASLWRFYLITVRPELGDSNFHWSDFADKVNNVLLAKFGNYFSRVTKFSSSRFGGVVPGRKTALTARDEEFIRDVNQHLQLYISHMEQGKLKDGQNDCLHLSQIGNQYMQENAPWALIKEDKDRVATVMNLQVQLVGLLSILIEPFMPSIGQEMQQQLNVSLKGFNDEDPHFDIDLMGEGHKFGVLQNLFKKMDSEMVSELRGRYGSPQESDEGENDTSAIAAALNAASRNAPTNLPNISSISSHPPQSLSSSLNSKTSFSKNHASQGAAPPETGNVLDKNLSNDGGASEHSISFHASSYADENSSTHVSHQQFDDSHYPLGTFHVQKTQIYHLSTQESLLMQQLNSIQQRKENLMKKICPLTRLWNEEFFSTNGDSSHYYKSTREILVHIASFLRVKSTEPSFPRNSATASLSEHSSLAQNAQTLSKKKIHKIPTGQKSDVHSQQDSSQVEESHFATPQHDLVSWRLCSREMRDFVDQRIMPQLFWRDFHSQFEIDEQLWRNAVFDTSESSAVATDQIQKPGKSIRTPLSTLSLKKKEKILRDWILHTHGVDPVIASHQESSIENNLHRVKSPKKLRRKRSKLSSPSHSPKRSLSASSGRPSSSSARRVPRVVSAKRKALSLSAALNQPVTNHSNLGQTSASSRHLNYTLLYRIFYNNQFVIDTMRMYLQCPWCSYHEWNDLMPDQGRQKSVLGKKRNGSMMGSLNSKSSAFSISLVSGCIQCNQCKQFIMKRSTDPSLEQQVKQKRRKSSGSSTKKKRGKRKTKSTGKKGLSPNEALYSSDEMLWKSDLEQRRHFESKDGTVYCHWCGREEGFTRHGYDGGSKQALIRNHIVLGRGSQQAFYGEAAFGLLCHKHHHQLFCMH